MAEPERPPRWHYPATASVGICLGLTFLTGSSIPFLIAWFGWSAYMFFVADHMARYSARILGIVSQRFVLATTYAYRTIIAGMVVFAALVVVGLLPSKV